MAQMVHFAFHGNYSYTHFCSKPVLHMNVLVGLMFLHPSWLWIVGVSGGVSGGLSAYCFIVNQLIAWKEEILP